MKRVVIALLCLVIIASGLAGIFAIGARGGAGNWFNTHWRNQFAQHPWLRDLYNLHNDGDAKTDYLGKATHSIRIIMRPYVDPWFTDAVWQAFAEEVTTVTGKEVIVSSDDTRIPKHTRPLYIYLASKDDTDPLTLGKTRNENGIILYKYGLTTFTKSSPRTLDAYTLSTLLHEFGHQIGLPHNEEAHCLMNSHAEAEHKPQNNISDVVTRFCINELTALQ